MIPVENSLENGGDGAAAVKLHFVDQENDVLACYSLIRQLRPHLDSEQAFLQRWQSQSGQCYRLLVLWHGTRPVGLAGFRVQDNLAHGRFVYVDDLVVDANCRSHGYGNILIERLKTEAKLLGCDKLLLDAAMNNALGHRFYYRQGLLVTALRFSMTVQGEGTLRL